ncbi:MAG: DNA-3-methyladenine glycosylase 2 family protein [Anaerolineales bacterium]|nr:DNA-3-methyladenine glycosylase 2 family protein [Anaerolineales bacterium]
MAIFKVAGTLAPAAPFSFDLALRFIERFNNLAAAQSVTTPASRPVLYKALGVYGRTVVARVQSTGQVEQPTLDYALFAPEPIDADLAAAAVDGFAFYLSLSDELRRFYAAGRADPIFAPLLETLYGYHQVKFTTPFESACWAVISQRNQWVTVQRMQRALAETFGGRLTVDGLELVAFPEPELLAVVPPAELARVIGHKPKGACLSAVAHAFAGADQRFLRTAPYAEVDAWLRGIRCLGPWSAGFVLMRGLGRMEGLPPGDRHIEAAVAECYGPTPLNALARRYAPYQGYWAHYLLVAQSA